MSYYDRVKNELGLSDNEIGSYQTDLHVKWSPERVKYFEKLNLYYERFTSAIDGTLWIDVPLILIGDRIARRRSPAKGA